MQALLENFHFIRPLWLLALLPLAALLWATARSSGAANAWQQVVDARLLPLLMAANGEGPARVNRQALWLLGAGWLVVTLALADPTWERKPQPVFQSTAARVVVLDLANSMATGDLKPDRLTQARFKVEDVLALGSEGQTGLVAYAGDAFTVAPLTRDANTIRALLKVLQPDLMPVQGSRADLGLLKARELLRQAGITQGQVLLMADGIPAGQQRKAEAAAEQLAGEGYQVSVLGVVAPGSSAEAALGAVAHAGGGRYVPISADGSALQSLLGSGQRSQVDAGAARADATARAWQEQGPLLALLLLPIALLGFRRNWLFGAMIVLAGFMAPPRPAMASTWDDLWQRPEQQAAQALAHGDYARAATLAHDADRRGSAEYKRGDFQKALDNFSHATGPDASYNRGNALAKLQHYPEAIAAYDQALKARPDDADAKANKAAVEALLKKQQQQQQQQPSQSGKNGQGKPQDQGQQQSQQQSQQQQQQQQSSAQNGSKPDASKPGSPQDSKPTSAASSPGQQGKPQPPDKSFAQSARQMSQQAQDKNAGDAKPGSPAQAAASANGQDQRVDANAQRIEGEEKLAAEQWLRAIPDDPGGLLRRKFLYQYRRRAQMQQLQQQQDDQ